MRVKLMIFLISCIIYQIGSLAETREDLLNVNTELPKVITLEDGNVLAVTTVKGEQKIYVSKLDKNGDVIYGNVTINYGYTSSAKLVEPLTEDKNYLIVGHNKQELSGHESKEFTLLFKDKDEEGQKSNRKNSLYKQTSVVALKSGKVLVAGINPPSSAFAQTTLELNIFNPIDGEYGNGLTLNAHSKYINCYEQKENEIYCVYVSFDNVFLSKLQITKFKVNENNALETGECETQTIKVFYTEFNYLKAIRFSDTEALVLFQTGNGNTNEVMFGNTGKDLYYYHLQTISDTKCPNNKLVSVVRYEYLFNECLYKDDPEYYNADIYPFSQKKIFAVCEYQENKFKGFIIYTDKKAIDRFNFNNFEASSVKNPVFAKFDNTLGLFYTHVNVNQNSKVVYQMINYPFCRVIEPKNFQIPLFFSHTFTFNPLFYLLNPYPASRANEKVYFRLLEKTNVKLVDQATNEELVLNKDYDPEELGLINYSFKSISYKLKYAASIKDPYDGFIIGKTCELKTELPECLEQCHSCNDTGTDAHHLCLGCKNESYFERSDPATIKDWYGKPHNCYLCNESCYSCFEEFLPSVPTTNCKRCKYEENYFPYENDTRTCISQETREYWESILGPLYLDKTGGENKESWVWRHCHRNCKKCEEGGDDNDNKCLYCIDNYYFFCNQTLGNGIPGSCHTDCVDNGFYKFIDTNEDNREKCCPCFAHCIRCKNDTMCDWCEKDWFKAPDSRSCDADCGYCYAKDDDLRECVNCKTRYKNINNNKEKYYLDGFCVDELPIFTYTEPGNNNRYVNKSYHVVDEFCNRIDACKEGCLNCSERFSDKCTKCSDGYYKEDFFGTTPPPENFRCFSKTTCLGLTQYPHNKTLRVGGVTVFEDENVCLNCKLRNNSYRLPENRFYCYDTKIDRTYIDIEDYNKLSDCYVRCKECDTWGASFAMNCLKCRDAAHYDLIKYDVKKGYGNCYRKAHKCGIYPYYHDYDLAPFVGKDEDDCGEDCDVCLYNFTCTESLPYFNLATHECVEFCPLTDVFGSKCNMSNPIAAIISLKNPLGWRDPYNAFTTPVNIREIIDSSFFEYIAKAYNIDVNTFKNDINNYLGNGKIYNLPQSQIIIGNNISIELTSFKLELEKLAKIFNGGEEAQNSIVDLSQCEALLKKKYGISDEEDLLIIKGDLIKKFSEAYLGNIVEYQVFSTSLGAFLPLSDCSANGITMDVYSPQSKLNLTTELQYKVAQTVGENYNPWDFESPFFNDICTPFTNENGNDVLLDDRRKDYYNSEVSLCEENCYFMGYNISLKMYACKCLTKGAVGEISGELGDEYKYKEMPEDFLDLVSRSSNIKVFKCASQVFSAKGQKKNFGSYVLIACFASFIGVIIFHFIKEKTAIDTIFTKLSSISGHPSNPPKPGKPDDKKKEHKEHHHHKSEVKVKQEKNVKGKIENNNPKSTKEVMNKPLKNPTNIQKDVVLKDSQLNFASYNQAIKNDKRTFIKYYWSLLKMKQICIFTFYTSEDYILRSTKIALFILFVAFYFAFTALFFNDSIMRSIYVYKGNTNAAVHIPNIILSSLCSIIMNLIVRFVCLNERDINKVIQESNPEKRKSLSEKARRMSKLILLIFFGVAAILIGICWYYVSAFCAVFKNSQGRYFLNVFISFLVCNIWPCVTSLIPYYLRKKAIDDGTSETLYKISQIISLF